MIQTNMKRISFCFLIILISSLPLAAQTKDKHGNNKLPAAISKMTGADSLELLNNPAIKRRLKRLLGKKNYESFLESFETVTPVKKNGTVLFASGCLIRACRQLESAIAINLASQTVHASFYRRGEKTKFFNENGRATPRVVKNWANRLAAN